MSRRKTGKTPEDQTLAADTGPEDATGAPEAGRDESQTEPRDPSEADAVPDRAETAGDDAIPGTEAPGARDVEDAETVEPVDTETPVGDPARRPDWAEEQPEDATASDDRTSDLGDFPEATHAEREDALAAGGASEEEPARRGAEAEEAAIAAAPGTSGRRTDEEYEQEHEHEEHGTSVAGRALAVVLIVIVTAIGALWAAPKLAPHVPAGVAKYLVAGRSDMADRIASLQSELAAAQERIAALEKGSSSSDTVNGVASTVSSLEGRVSGIEDDLASLRDRIDAMGSASSASEAPAGVTPDQLQKVSSALSDLSARVETLSQNTADPEAVASLRSQVGEVQTQVSSLSDRIGEMQSTREQEIARLERELRSDALGRAVTSLRQQAASGRSFSPALSDVEKLTNAKAPEAVKAAAETDVPSTQALLRSMSEPAQAAIAADVKAGATDDTMGQIGAWFRSQVTARPTTAREGQSVSAILSRIDAALEAGNAQAALKEAETLPDYAKDALGGWLDQLRARAELDRSLSEWTASLGANG